MKRWWTAVERESETGIWRCISVTFSSTSFVEVALFHKHSERKITNIIIYHWNMPRVLLDSGWWQCWRFAIAVTIHVHCEHTFSSELFTIDDNNNSAIYIYPFGFLFLFLRICCCFISDAEDVERCQMPNADIITDSTCVIQQAYGIRAPQTPYKKSILDCYFTSRVLWKFTAVATITRYGDANGKAE